MGYLVPLICGLSTTQVCDMPPDPPGWCRPYLPLILVYLPLYTCTWSLYHGQVNPFDQQATINRSGIHRPQARGTGHRSTKGTYGGGVRGGHPIPPGRFHQDSYIYTQHTNSPIFWREPCLNAPSWQVKQAVKHTAPGVHVGQFVANICPDMIHKTCWCYYIIYKIWRRPGGRPP